MILVDASDWIDYFRDNRTPQVERLDGLLGRQKLAIGDLSLAEVLQGFRGDHAFERSLFRLSSLALIRIVDRDIAIQAARNYRTLRGRDITVRGTIDTLIATRCMMDGHALLFSDRDFEPFVEWLGLRDGMAGGPC